MEELIRRTCGRLYKWFSAYCGDQTKCPECREKLEKEFIKQNKKPSTYPDVPWEG